MSRQRLWNCLCTTACIMQQEEQQFDRDHLVTVRVLAQDRKLAVGKEAIQIHGLPGLADSYPLGDHCASVAVLYFWDERMAASGSAPVTMADRGRRHQ